MQPYVSHTTRKKNDNSGIIRIKVGPYTVKIKVKTKIE